MADQSEGSFGARDPESRQQVPDPQTTLERVFSLVNSAPSLIYLKDTSFRYLFINRRFERDSGKSNAEMFGQTDDMIMPPQFVAQVHADEVKVLETGEVVAYEEEVETPRGRRHFATIKLPVYDRDGQLIGIGGFVTDITERKLELLEQQRTIVAQREALRELSTPLLPIADGVLAMPLIGVIDPPRARQIVDELLQGVVAHRAHTAILDVTGIRLMDADVARALVEAARAAKLVGARVVLTGISPEIAQVLVGLDADLSGVTTLATLASGIAFALEK